MPGGVARRRDQPHSGCHGDGSVDDVEVRPRVVHRGRPDRVVGVLGRHELVLLHVDRHVREEVVAARVVGVQVAVGDPLDVLAAHADASERRIEVEGPRPVPLGRLRIGHDAGVEEADGPTGPDQVAADDDRAADVDARVLRDVGRRVSEVAQRQPLDQRDGHTAMVTRERRSLVDSVPPKSLPRPRARSAP